MNGSNAHVDKLSVYFTVTCIKTEVSCFQELFQEHAMGQGKVVHEGKEENPLIHETVCFPLYSILLAMNRTQVDYLSLDVEGLELPILKTIPFDKLQIKMLSVEYNHQGQRAGCRVHEE